jgi:hypothetical protein
MYVERNLTTSTLKSDNLDDQFEVCAGITSTHTHLTQGVDWVSTHLDIPFHVTSV